MALRRLLSSLRGGASAFGLPGLPSPADKCCHHGLLSAPATRDLSSSCPALLQFTRSFAEGPKLDSAESMPRRRGRVSFVNTIGDQNKNPWNPNLYPEEVRYDDPLAGLSPAEQNLSKEMILRINNQIREESHGRLFAVIFIASQQFRVTDGDIIMVSGTYHLAIGEKVKFEKVLAAGCSDFTLLGRPMLDRTLVDVEATCIEKTLSYPELQFVHIKPIPLRRRKFLRNAQTMIRINRVSFKRLLNEQPNPDDVVHECLRHLPDRSR